MLRSTLVYALVATASATTELTPDNFDDLVLKSGKAAFIKFLAPWVRAPPPVAPHTHNPPYSCSQHVRGVHTQFERALVHPPCQLRQSHCVRPR